MRKANVLGPGADVTAIRDQERKLYLHFYKTMDRERRHIQSEFVQVKGLMPLLMKPRNNQKWTQQDKHELRLHLKLLSRVSAYVALLVMPGGFAVLPVMAWWLDRRRSRRSVPQVKQRIVNHDAQTLTSIQRIAPVIPESKSSSGAPLEPRDEKSNRCPRQSAPAQAN